MPPPRSGSASPRNIHRPVAHSPARLARSSQLLMRIGTVSAMSPNVHGEPRALLSRASVSTVLLERNWSESLRLAI